MPQTPPSHLTSRTVQGVLVLTLTDAHLRGDPLVRALQKQLLGALPQAGAPPRVVLDLKSVQALASEAFRPLLSLRRKLQDAGGRLALANLSPAVAQALQSTRLISTRGTPASPFEVHADVAAAVASLTQADEG
jgi:anti-anti-sigma factor